MRAVFVSSGLAGHFEPLVPLMDACRRRGDQVVAVVPSSFAAAAERTGHAIRAGADPPAEEAADIRARAATAPRAEAAVLINRELFGRLCTTALLHEVEAAIRDVRPDVVVHEPSAYAGAVAAARHGIPHARAAISVAEVERAALRIAAPALEDVEPGVPRAIERGPYLTRFPEAIDRSPFIDTRRYRVPAPAGDPPPGWQEAGDPRVYLTFGTVAGSLDEGPALYRTALAAIRELPTRVIVAAGGTRIFAAARHGVQVEEWVDQPRVLRHAEAVVCHGGSGTVLGALAAGTPLVVVPLLADQHENARRVVHAGAGVAAGPLEAVGSWEQAAAGVDATAIRDGLAEVLRDPGYAAAAMVLGHAMQKAPPLDAVLASLAAA